MTANQELEGIIRSKEMNELLQRLEKEDRIFEHNVPEDVLDSLDDGRLLDHLRETYSQDEFILENPDLVEKYMYNHGSLVIKKGVFKRKRYRLKRGAEGVVTEVYDQGALVYFEKYSHQWVSEKNLVVYGRVVKGFFSNRVKNYPETPAEDFKLKEGDLVKYAGKDLYKVNDKILDGVRGVVAHNFGEAGMDIVWVHQPGTQQWRFYDSGDQTSGGCSLFRYDEIKLVIKNHLDFDKLYRECYGEREDSQR